MKDEAAPSRSQKKRDSTALQQRGADIAALAPARRRRLPLPEELDEALRHYDSITNREGRRRQMQFIGRIMREMDEDVRTALLEALDSLQEGR